MVQEFKFTTGPATLPDIGTLSYSGCVFSPLFASEISGSVVRDNAGRTTKFMEYDITVDGYVTTPGNEIDVSTSGAMSDLRTLITTPGGTLKYLGRGFDLIVNAAGGGGGGGGFKGGVIVNQVGVTDVAWGPVPKLLEFQPLGGGFTAKVRWQVTVRIPETAGVTAKGAIGPLLQFNEETVVTYGEDGYSSLSIKGTIEIPLTRSPNQKTRTLTTTVDDYRVILETRLMAGIDLSRFRVTRRNFPVSRDKRTMEWDFALEEKPYMDLPPDCTVARGTYSVRPAKTGMGLVLWLCTLRATYTVRKDRPRRVAWDAFLALLRLRMLHSQLGLIPALNGGNQNPARGAVKVLKTIANPYQLGQEVGAFWRGKLNAQNQAAAPARKAWLIDFSFDEGLYLDSKPTSFSASWRLVTIFSHILLASGLWTKLQEEDVQGNNLWATSMRNVSGSQSWLPNKLDPALDIIVDFGGG